MENHIEAAWEQIGTSSRDASSGTKGRRTTAPTSFLVTDDEISRCARRRHGRSRSSTIEDPGSGDRESGTSWLLSVQPTAIFHGRIPIWVNDVKTAQANGDRVVFVAGSHGRAERTVELLQDYDVRAVMATDAGDVVAGAVMVAEGWLSKGFAADARV